MLLRSLAYLRPDTVAEAVSALAGAEHARALAGGQSLLNVLKHRAAAVDLLVDVSRLEELRSVEVRADGSARLGAAVTYDELEHHDALRAAHPKVAEVAGGLVDQQVRCRGTIGGNVCYADPASNFPPLLVALGATLHVTGPDGDRDVAAGDFVTGPYRTALRRGELLRAISLPALDDGDGVGYRSLQVGRDSWAVARTAAFVRANGTIGEARVVLGCLGGAPQRAAAVEERLRGREPTPELLHEAAQAAAEGIDPVGDAHAGAGYRRAMTCVMTHRALLDATGLG